MTKKRKLVVNDEIDLKELAKVILENKKSLIQTIIIFFICGLILAFGSKIEYQASCKLLPETEDGINLNMLGGIGGLASMAGFDLSSMGNSYNTITPDLYPELLKSYPFQLKVLNNPVYFEKIDTSYTPFYYFKEIEKPSFVEALFKYTIGLPFQVKEWLFKPNEKKEINTEGVLRLSLEDQKIIEKFQDRISLEIDSKTGIVTLQAEMPDPNAAAEVTNFAIKILTEYIIDYKTSKVQNNLVFIQERYDEAKYSFEKTQNKLAMFNDRNKNVATSYAKMEQERLQNDYNIAFDVYKELATQLEQAKIMVKKETPVFKILEPVQVPIEKYKPKYLVIIVVALISGLVLKILHLYLKLIFA